jgi:NAD(P)-dependent dehydrogenase (short-subunit alcohol dehydrogenase family)
MSASSNAKRRIVLTGVTRGLGRAMAEAFIALGHEVHGCGRSEEAVARLAAEYGPPHDFEVVDVSRADQVVRWARRVLEQFGPPDLLINNAAVMSPNAPLWRVSDEDFSRLVDVNIKGIANVTRAFVPSMVARRTGVIVNFSSYWGRSVAAEVAPYCATKWAVEGLTQALAQELPSGMAAVPFNPGIIDTDMLRTCFGASAKHYTAPDAWARTAVPFLLAIEARDNGKQLTAPGQ